MANSKRDELLQMLNDVFGEQDKLYTELPEAERIAPGAWERWSPKDLLAHFNFWGDILLRDLDNLDTPPADNGAPFDERNRANYDRNQPRAYGDVQADNDKVRADLISRITACDDAALTENNRFPRLPNNSIAGRVVGVMVSHNYAHLAQFCIERGDMARALQLQETGVSKVSAFDPTPRMQGTSLYNLACFYALNNFPERAIELLGQAFLLRPDLREFSNQDTDLDSLRSLNAYKSLFN
jgi:hypothetical protein